MRKAFEYCLDRVGCAAGAGPLWLQYCALLQRPRAGTTDFAALFGTPPAGQEEAARSAAVRCAAHETDLEQPDMEAHILHIAGQ